MPALTRLTIQQRIADIINDPNNTRWSAAKVQDQIQASQEKFVEETKALTDVQSFSIVGGTRQYALSTDTLGIKRVALNGLPLSPMSEFDLDIFTGRDWTLITGTPSQYFVDYASTNKNITLYPTPTGNDAGTGNLVVEYIKVPPTLSGDSSAPLNSQTLLQPYLMAIVYDAASYFLYASKDPADWAKAKNCQGMFLQEVSRCQEVFDALSETRPARMRGGRYFKGT